MFLWERVFVDVANLSAYTIDGRKDAWCGPKGN
jgi:hypothetical protein